jgi:hypothetical protein
MMMTKSLLALALSFAVFAGAAVGQEQEVRKQQMRDIELLQRLIVRKELNEAAKRLNEAAKRLNPLLAVDGYKAALDKVSDIRARLEAVDDPRAASLLLDELSRAIDEARRALWVREQAKKKDK